MVKDSPGSHGEGASHTEPIYPVVIPVLSPSRSVIQVK